MTAANMARYKGDPNYPFWRMLKQGYDIFEATRQPPQVDVCEKRYVFNVRGSDDRPLSSLGACPAGVGEGELALSWKEEKTAPSSVLAAMTREHKKAPNASIQGLEEARLVADWSRRRARGEKVSRLPPTLNQVSDETLSEPSSSSAPQPVSTPATPAQAVAVPAVSPVSEPQSPPVEQKKKGWSLFRSKS